MFAGCKEWITQHLFYGRRKVLFALNRQFNDLENAGFVAN